MIKVAVLYPHQEGSKFDMGYYLKKHIPMVIERLGAACKGASVDRGITGMDPETPPAFAVIAQLTFESLDAFQAAFAPHAAEIMADISNYTSIQPTIQFSEVNM